MGMLYTIYKICTRMGEMWNFNYYMERYCYVLLLPVFWSGVLAWGGPVKGASKGEAKAGPVPSLGGRGCRPADEELHAKRYPLRVQPVATLSWRLINI